MGEKSEGLKTAPAVAFTVPEGLAKLHALVAASRAEVSEAAARLADAEAAENKALCFGDAKAERAALSAARTALSDAERALNIRETALDEMLSEAVPAVAREMAQHDHGATQGHHKTVAALLDRILAEFEELELAVKDANARHLAIQAEGLKALGIPGSHPMSLNAGMNIPAREDFGGVALQARGLVQNWRDIFG